MEEKKVVYQIILDCWEIAKKYLFIKLNDDTWNDFIQLGHSTSEKYKNCDKPTQKLFSSIFTAFVVYKETKDKGRVNE